MVHRLSVLCLYNFSIGCPMYLGSELDWRLAVAVRTRWMIILIAAFSATLFPRGVMDVSHALLALAVIVGLSSLWSP